MTKALELPKCSECGEIYPPPARNAWPEVCGACRTWDCVKAVLVCGRCEENEVKDETDTCAECHQAELERRAEGDR